MTVADPGKTRQDDAQGRTQGMARKYDARRFRASAPLASLVVALAFLSASDILIPQAQETRSTATSTAKMRSTDGS